MGKPRKIICGKNLNIERGISIENLCISLAIVPNVIHKLIIHGQERQYALNVMEDKYE